ncbi:Copper-transporting ATPase HMA4 [Camellia lanceoleosa]|uniref:Copper-transporting ATPase HMA4 n=1 Tax=Camellia lanceoleosa TaxID=1840588 RepID=A0ACC0J1T0_9ERIC|nr:Copper-transporting ATPase HMA4 [Camellia lanceoleosa]
MSEIEISTQLLQRNDILNIVPEAMVPVDGIVINGQSHVNEGMITGEAKPIAKRPSDTVQMSVFSSKRKLTIHGIILSSLFSPAEGSEYHSINSTSTDSGKKRNDSICIALADDTCDQPKIRMNNVVITPSFKHS